MTIYHVEGKDADGVANTLRNAQISAGKGALLVTAKGEPEHQIEKIIVGEPLVAGTPAAEISWKPGSVVICPGKLVDKLAAFEKLVPGFKKHFGPVTKISA